MHKLHAGDESNECLYCFQEHSLYYHHPLSLYQQTMATCVSQESNPFTTFSSFTLKPRAEKCLDDNFKDRLLAPSIGRGLRIQSSFEIEEAQTRARSLTEPQASAASVTVEPPSWAVRASGEARLEPVGATSSTHGSVDLSLTACIRVGRSPSSDMRLLHPTSSRKHALIFHHPNGYCYVVDCGSAHGTYVNGVRVGGPVVQEGSNEVATAVPHRVKRGALVRFGGPGAPTFVLKSFSASFENLVQALCDGKTTKSHSPKTAPGVSLSADEGTLGSIIADEGGRSSSATSLPPTTPRPSTPTPSKSKECEPKGSSLSSPRNALIALNTRVNALGGGAVMSKKNCMIARNAATKFVTGPEVLDQIVSCLLGKRSRSPNNIMAFNSNERENFMCDCPTRESKRLRAASYPLSPDPRRSCLKHDLDLLHTPLVFERLVTSLDEEVLGRNIRRRKVQFSDEIQNFYPASVTPDEMPGSFDEEHIMM
mmetsp:Transcript_21416/g.44843  ORF Transcript_21416/g.44843 Transcript_21416/m.44843 type:complete len:482 (-) Transcript_21416:299-1744(-)